jgi:hypothetical protein
MTELVDASYWLAGAYYIEWDQQGELRIAGPDNHLYYGSIGLDRDQTTISSVRGIKDELVMELEIAASSFLLADPAMGHIRKVRAYIEPNRVRKPSFAEVEQRHPGALAPNYLTAEDNVISYRRNYDGNFYGVVITVPPEAEIVRKDRKKGFLITTKGDVIKLTLKTVTGYARVRTDRTYDGPIFEHRPETTGLLGQTAAEITHLVRYNKTSGFDFGTVFPRDWMEAADLGLGDLDVAAIRHMYHKAIEFIDGQGEGWHENIVGEFAAERRDEIKELASTFDELVRNTYPVSFNARRYVHAMEETFIVRNMIDIEPHYLLGLATLPPQHWSPDDIGLLRRVAHYILNQAEDNDLITFKKLPPKLKRHKQEEYYGAGNWRDSHLAYQVVSPIIAPYDVNAVFYPQALVLIHRYAERLNVDAERAERLIAKWSKVKDKYRFTNDDGSEAYALALYDVHQKDGMATYKMLRVNHTDEAYDLFYGVPSEEEVTSFAKRLLDPAYFYTSSGPTVVGHGEGYNTTYYHGEVIWTKQTAFIVAGLYRQLHRDDVKWKPATMILMREAAIKSAEANMKAVDTLGVVPELHYDVDGVPHLYSDQPKAEGPMNTVQLWSAIGIRRILKVHHELTKKAV